MKVEMVFRIIGLLVLGLLGAYWGYQFSEIINIQRNISAAIFGISGAILGFILAPYFTTRPARMIRNNLSRVSGKTLVAGFLGLIAGLVIAALAAFPLALLPSPFGEILPFIGLLVFGYLGIMVFVMRQDDIFSILRIFPIKSISHEEKPGLNNQVTAQGRTILLDTSVIIDGRIADISRTGFINGTLLIPRFVLNELQYIADSSDALRRQRGRRGLEVLAQLQKDNIVPVKINDIDVEGVKEVDDKLVVLARQLGCPILTNDYNLNQVAELQGVSVLNVNELANAVKSVFLPGETLLIDIIQEGRESGQGIAYLEDGTMVVVEDGRGFINNQVNVTITKVLQTAAGKMIFSRMQDGDPESE